MKKMSTSGHLKLSFVINLYFNNTLFIFNLIWNSNRIGRRKSKIEKLENLGLQFSVSQLWYDGLWVVKKNDGFM